MNKGIFITLEGIDASGKTTQFKRLGSYLKKKGFDVVRLREPGGEEVSEKMRKILLNNKFSLTSEAELFLYLASRSQLVANKIIPALKEKKLVICDRFSDSTLAYQGYGRGLDLKLVEILNSLSTNKLRPDLTILIDLSLEESVKRAKNKKKDRLERSGISFYKKVRKGYLEIARKEKKRIKVVDGKGGIDETWEKVKSAVDRFLQIE